MKRKIALALTMAMLGTCLAGRMWTSRYRHKCIYRSKRCYSSRRNRSSRNHRIREGMVWHGRRKDDHASFLGWCSAGVRI